MKDGDRYVNKRVSEARHDLERTLRSARLCAASGTAMNANPPTLPRVVQSNRRRRVQRPAQRVEAMRERGRGAGSRPQPGGQTDILDHERRLLTPDSVRGGPRAPSRRSAFLRPCAGRSRFLRARVENRATLPFADAFSRGDRHLASRAASPWTPVPGSACSQRRSRTVTASASRRATRAVFELRFLTVPFQK